MPLNIKNLKVENLAAEVADLTGETKTEAIRRALEERKQRLSFQLDSRGREGRLLEFLEQEVWPVVPADQLRRRLTRKEEDDILGFNSGGV